MLRLPPARSGLPARLLATPRPPRRRRACCVRAVAPGSDAQPAKVKTTTLADGRVLLSLQRSAEKDAAETSTDARGGLAGFAAQMGLTVVSKLAAAARSALPEVPQVSPTATLADVDAAADDRPLEDRWPTAGRSAEHWQAFGRLNSALAASSLTRFVSELVRASPVPVALLPLVDAEPVVVQAFAWEGLFTGNWSWLRYMPEGIHPFTDEDKYMRPECSMQLSLAQWCGLEASPDVPGKWQADADDAQLFTPRRKARPSRGAERAKGAAAAAQQPAVVLGDQTLCDAATPLCICFSLLKSLSS
jgi:hypothetical protein